VAGREAGAPEVGHARFGRGILNEDEVSLLCAISPSPMTGTVMLPYRAA
jgi:hypothetical protein